MPWQFRKRVRLGTGVHLNVGKRSVSLSVGGRYSRTSLSTSGHVTQTYSLPGTGLYHRERARLLGPGEGGSIILPVAAPPAESSYAEGMQAFLEGDFVTAYRGFSAARKGRQGSVGADLLAGISAFMTGRVPDAIAHLERVVAADEELPDELMSRYAPRGEVRLRFEVAIVQGIYVSLGVDSLAAALLLAEAYQGVGKRDQAIELMSELLELGPNDEAVRLSLSDLLFEAADFAGTIEVASPAAPRTNLGFTCQIFKAQAESWIGDWEAAKVTLESALSNTQADDESALAAAHENLAGAYAELGLSSKRLTAFQAALARKRKALPKDPRVVRSATYESKGYEPAEK